MLTGLILKLGLLCSDKVEQIRTFQGHCYSTLDYTVLQSVAQAPSLGFLGGL